MILHSANLLITGRYFSGKSYTIKSISPTLSNTELVEIKKKRQTIIAVAIAVVMCVLVIILWRVIYVRTYGMDAETHAQWETALQEYKAVSLGQKKTIKSP